jgi:hypothetical protein
LQVALAAGLLAALCWTRLRWLDAAACGVWQLASLGCSQRRLRATIRLLEWRCRRCGRRRPASVTLSQWYGELARCLPPEAATALSRFVPQAERCLYGPQAEDSAAHGRRSIHQVCRCVAREVTLPMLLQARPDVPPVGQVAAVAQTVAQEGWLFRNSKKGNETCLS